MRHLLGVVACAACFSPRPPSGAQCSPDGTCPDDLSCVASVCVVPGTQPLDAAGDDAAIHDGLPPDTRVLDALARDARVGSASFALIGSGVSAGTAASLGVSASVDRTVPAGALVIALIGGRGVTPVAVTDSAGNTWTMAVQITNSSSTAAAAIAYATLTTELAGNAAISASFGTSQDPGEDRGIAVLLATGVSTLDQIGSAAGGLTTTPSATTPAVTGAPELVVGVTATGFQQPATIAPTGGFASQLAWSTTLSSASLDAKIDASPQGGESYADTTTQNANYAVAVAAFE